MQMDHALEDMPNLLPMDSDDESDSDDGSSDTEDDVGNEADDEGSEMLENEMVSRPQLVHYVRNVIEKMYSQRYEQPHNEPISQPLPQMPHVLKVLKVECPDQF